MEELKRLGFKDLSYLMHSGIYVLCLKGEVVYVGQTINIFGRLDKEDHRHRVYDKIYFVRCELYELNRIETLMIMKLKPKHQTTYNTNTNPDLRNMSLTGAGPSEVTFGITVGGTQLQLRGRRRI